MLHVLLFVGSTKTLPKRENGCNRSFSKTLYVDSRTQLRDTVASETVFGSTAHVIKCIQKLWDLYWTSCGHDVNNYVIHVSYSSMLFTLLY